MKRLILSFLAVVCIAAFTGAAFAAPAAQIDGHRLYFYSTSARDAYNFARLYLYGDTIRIVRRGYQDPLEADQVRILQSGAVLFSLAPEWEEAPVEGNYYGYTLELDASGWADGEYLLSIESSAMKWNTDPSGELSGVRSPYALASVRVVKQGDECRFPPDASVSGRYNGILLQQLQQGNAPDDFAVLREFYEKQDNGHILSRIEAKTAELTGGLYTDLEKCLAVSRWISENIAYDFDFPRGNTDGWLKAHPEDSRRLEDALNAFDRGYAQCYGYAKLTTLMLGYAGVDSVYIKGCSKDDISSTWSSAAISDSYSSSWNASVPHSWFSKAADGTEVPDVYNHAWNAVRISGSWYFLDTCKDAMYGYYRTDSADAGTAYTKLNQCYSGAFVFPSPSQLSNTHIAIRYGAEGYGSRVEEQ